MSLKRKLNQKVKGTKMAITGIGGIILNEISGFISGEIQTIYELNQLPKGYVIKGFGHFIENNNLIDKGRNYINNYRLKQKIKQGIFTN